MTRLVWLVHLVMQLLALVTTESYFVLRYKRFDISFNNSTFEGFYKCLCNTAKNNCVATTDTLRRPAERVNVITVDQVYTAKYADTHRRECVIQEHGANDKHLTINCTVSRNQCHKVISLVPHNEARNDVCGSTEVEIAWQNDVHVKCYNDAFIHVRNCRDEKSIESMQHPKKLDMQHLTLIPQANQEKRLPKVGHNFITIGASVGGFIMVSVIIAVIITVMRRKNIFRPGIFKEKPSEQALDNSGHYQTVDFNTPRIASVNQDSGIIRVNYTREMNDKSYSIIDITTSYPDSITKISINSRGLHQIDSISYNDARKVNGSEVNTDKIILCDQPQVRSFEDICLIELPVIPTSEKPISTQSQDIPDIITCKETFGNKIKEVNEESEIQDFGSSSFLIRSTNSEKLASNESDTPSHCYFTLTNPVLGPHSCLHLEQKDFGGAEYSQVTSETPHGVVFSLNENDSHYSKLRRQPRDKKNNYDTILPSSTVIDASEVVPQSPH